jgi:signal recognition particle subunit SRP54
MGIPGMPGGRTKGKAQKKAKKGRRVSGDPRKAALGKPEPEAPAEPKQGGVLGNLGGKLPPGMDLPAGFDPSKLRLPGQK